MSLLLETFMPPEELKRAFAEGSSKDFKLSGELDVEITTKYYLVIKGLPTGRMSELVFISALCYVEEFLRLQAEKKGASA